MVPEFKGEERGWQGFNCISCLFGPIARKSGSFSCIYFSSNLSFILFLVLNENGTKTQVKWDVWAGIDERAFADLLRSREVASKRILLEGPYCRQWYLGERVVRQSLGYGAFRVPKPIPQLSSRKLTKDVLIEWLEGQDAAAFLEEEGMDYREYRTQRLMGPLGVGSAERGRRQGPLAKVITAAVAGGGGAEIQKRSRRTKLPKLPQRVGYMLNSGYMKYIELPNPPSGAYRLPPHVQQV